jgi:hypothetical protein
LLGGLFLDRRGRSRLINSHVILRAIFRTLFKCLYDFTLFRTGSGCRDSCRLHLFLPRAVGPE